MQFEPVQTREGWVRLAAEKEEVARALVSSKTASRQAWEAAGFAVECMLKAEIMRVHRLNVFPDDPKSPYWGHSLRALYKTAGLQHEHHSLELKASLSTAFRWKREHSYTENKFPRNEARSMVEAVFGPKGVVTWLRSRQ